jgi:iron complex outermembrane recepter protein
MLRSFTSALPKTAIALLLGTSAFALAGAAAAQTADTSAAPVAKDDPNVVIVTANKRREPVQKVAQTVNVVGGQTIKDLHIQSFQEVASAVGGLSLTRTSGSEQSVSLRGIKMPPPGAAGGTTNTVEIYQNEVPISATDAFNAIFDIGQIEVLRGPQGTLRGRPSPSGAMTIATRRGSYTGYDGFIEGGASDHNGKNVQAGWGGPITPTLAFRVAGIYDENDDNEVKSQYTGKISHHKTTGFRGSLGWKPVDGLEINLSQQHVSDDRDFYRSVQGTDIVPTSIGYNKTYSLNDRVALNSGTNINTYEGDLTTLTARYEIGNYAFNYVGGYNSTQFYSGLDFDFAGIGAAQIPSVINVDSSANTLSNELRFESLNGAFYNFTYGVFTSKVENKSHVVFAPFFTGDNASNVTDFGAFTNQRFNLSDKDKLELGIRYSKFEVDRLGAGPNTTYQAITGNASYQHQFNQDVMGYVTYGKSYRPGSGNANTVNNPIPATFANFGPEHSQSLEAGIKSQWFDKRLTANLALFNQEYTGYINQAFNIACTGVPSTTGMAFATADGTPGGTICFNTDYGNGDAISKGVEIELRGKITDDFTAGINYTYTDAHFQNATLPCNDYNGDGVPDVNGIAKIQQGKYVSLCKTSQVLGALSPTSISANTNYNFVLGGLTAYVRANATYRDKYYFPQTARYLPGDTRVNAYLGIKGAENKWEISIWAKNLFDHVVQDTDGGPWAVGGNPSGLNIGTVTNRREVGVTLRRDF